MTLKGLQQICMPIRSEFPSSLNGFMLSQMILSASNFWSMQLNHYVMVVARHSIYCELLLDSFGLSGLHRFHSLLEVGHSFLLAHAYATMGGHWR